MISKLKSEFKALRYSLYHRLAFSPTDEQKLTDGFHKLYYDSAVFGKTWNATTWMGVKTGKCPLDLWNYQELFYRLKPDLIIETGTFFGGSAYYFASLCDLLGKGRVITIDLEAASTTRSREIRPSDIIRPSHPRLDYWQGSSTSDAIIKRLEPLVERSPVVLVSLDSDHRQVHVSEELRLYSRFVTPGSYMIVEDTNINGHPVYPEYGPGPWEAVEDFLKENPNFNVDEELNYKHLLTLHPQGYLKKLR